MSGAGQRYAVAAAVNHCSAAAATCALEARIMHTRRSLKETIGRKMSISLRCRHRKRMWWQAGGQAGRPYVNLVGRWQCHCCDEQIAI